jgi:hypothetical protein
VRFLLFIQNTCYIFSCEQERPRLTGRPLETFGAGAERGKEFFIWIRRNPLKSPESAKGIQGNPSFFPWYFFGFAWIYLE